MQVLRHEVEVLKSGQKHSFTANLPFIIQHFFFFLNYTAGVFLLNKQCSSHGVLVIIKKKIEIPEELLNTLCCTIVYCLLTQPNLYDFLDVLVVQMYLLFNYTKV